MVFPGPKMGDGPTLAALIKEESITLAAGVPTVWQLLLNHAREAGIKLSPLRRVSVGGSACPLAIMEEFRERHGAEVLHAWGMTETSPIGTLNVFPRGFEDWPKAEQDALRVKQGQPVFGVQVKIVDEAGQGTALGRQDLRCREGPRSLGVQRLLPTSDTPARRMRSRAGSPPATWPP